MKGPVDDLIARYNKAIEAEGGYLAFDDLIPEAQTVIASVASSSHGDLAKQQPKFWQIVTSQDFRTAVVNLHNFGDRFRGRRNSEGSLLDHALTKSNNLPQKKVVGPALAPALSASILGKPASGDRCFPVSTLTKSSWETGACAFGSNRDGGARAHAACDLYYPANTTFHAVADGKVIRGQYPPLLPDLRALEIDHRGFTVRYGEISSALVKEGDAVKVGQKIAKVGLLMGITVPGYMLHLEMYAGTDKGHAERLSGSATCAKRKGTSVPC